MSAITLERWVLAAVVDEGPVVGPRTYRTRDELAAVVLAEHHDLFGDTRDPDFDEGEDHWQLVVDGNSGWYGSKVRVVVEVAEDGSLT